MTLVILHPSSSGFEVTSPAPGLDPEVCAHRVLAAGTPFLLVDRGAIPETPDFGGAHHHALGAAALDAMTAALAAAGAVAAEARRAAAAEASAHAEAQEAEARRAAAAAEREALFADFKARLATEARHDAEVIAANVRAGQEKASRDE